MVSVIYQFHCIVIKLRINTYNLKQKPNTNPVKGVMTYVPKW